MSEPKRATKATEIDGKALYAVVARMTTREIKEQLADLGEVDLSSGESLFHFSDMQVSAAARATVEAVHRALAGSGLEYKVIAKGAVMCWVPDIEARVEKAAAKLS